MPDVKTDILVEVVTSGQEQLKELDKGLGKLGGTVTKHTEGAKKNEAATAKSTKTLGKQIPVLREISPLLGAVGLGFLSGATALSALAVGATLATQTFNTWMAGMLGLNIAQNTFGGQLTDLSVVMGEARERSDKLGISMNQYTDAMTKLIGVTHDPAASFSILNDAVSISHATGLPLNEVVDALSKAFSEGAWSNGNFVQPGVLALQTLETQLRATGSAQQGVKVTVNDAWSNITNTIGTGVGQLASDVDVGFKKIAINAYTSLSGTGKWATIIFGPAGTLLDMFTGFATDLGKADIWNGIGKWWSEKWGVFKEWLGGQWQSLLNMFSGVDWNAVWSNVGQTWSNIWRGAVNLVISAVNWMIQQLNKIQWTLPDWVPFIGGKHFGINISEIPKLAHGTPDFAGGPAIVGENGPELVSLPRGTSVTPNNQLGSRPINIYLGNELVYSAVIDQFDSTVRMRGAY